MTQVFVGTWVNTTPVAGYHDNMLHRKMSVSISFKVWLQDDSFSYVWSPVFSAARAIGGGMNKCMKHSTSSGGGGCCWGGGGVGTRKWAKERRRKLSPLTDRPNITQAHLEAKAWLALTNWNVIGDWGGDGGRGGVHLIHIRAINNSFNPVFSSLLPLPFRFPVLTIN